jgi:hypothetical protein
MVRVFHGELAMPCSREAPRAPSSGRKVSLYGRETRVNGVALTAFRPVLQVRAFSLVRKYLGQVHIT